MLKSFLQESEREFNEKFPVNADLSVAGQAENIKKFYSSKLRQLIEEVRKGVEGKKRQDAVLEPFNITAEYRLGELRGTNHALDSVLAFLSEFDNDKK